MNNAERRKGPHYERPGRIMRCNFRVMNLESKHRRRKDKGNDSHNERHAHSDQGKIHGRVPPRPPDHEVGLISGSDKFEILCPTSLLCLETTALTS